MIRTAMHLASTPRFKTPKFSFSHCAAIAFLAVATFFAPILSPSCAKARRARTLGTLAKIRETWVLDLHNKQLGPILQFYAEDAVFLQPTGERIAGPAALRTLFQTVMATFTSDLTLHSQNLEASGDLAYDSGDFQETLTTVATGAKISTKGSYLFIYKRQLNGLWLIVQQVFTGTPPPGA